MRARYAPIVSFCFGIWVAEFGLASIQTPQSKIQNPTGTSTREIMKMTAIAGGVGAAKFLSGLVRVLPPEEITVVVNTGDDFRWMGLYICPDLDTITYTLAGLDNPVTGWGIRDETYHCLDRLRALGCETWFALGDRDLATHVYRTGRIKQGDSLTEITASLSRRNGVAACILPMTDSPVPTMIHTEEGTLAFQDYFVRRNCQPQVRGFTFEGIENAHPAPGVLRAFQESDAIIVCPSNPFVSIGPILAVPGIQDALRESPATILAVSPIVAGEAIKGPAAAMMRQLGFEASASGVASLYRDFADVFVLDRRDESQRESISALGLQVCSADTIMSHEASRVALANSILEMLS